MSVVTKTTTKLCLNGSFGVTPTAKQTVEYLAKCYFSTTSSTQFTFNNDVETKANRLKRHGSSHSKNTEVLRNPTLNKGMAFTLPERQQLGIHGLLPPAVLSQEVQALRIMTNFHRETNDLDKYIDLINLQDRNEKLFYRVLMDNLELIMPIVYTPTVGLACQKYGVAFRRARGLFITIHDKGHIYDVLCNWPESRVRVIVVTDGERILGLGDLGCYGMGIPVGKLSLYTALSGIPPEQCLPIMIDVGTNNQTLLDDPLYIGLRQRRATGALYDEFMDEFMEAVIQRFGRNCLVQFEDFASHNAYRFLEKYRKKYCMFNDDIQGKLGGLMADEASRPAASFHCCCKGTAAVALGGILSGLKSTNVKLEDNRFLFVGAGQAACGIADLITLSMSQSANIPIEEARKQVFMFDIDGLLVEGRPEGQLEGPKGVYTKTGLRPTRDLTDAIAQVKPTALIGASGSGGIFKASALQKMAELNQRPIIFALSNPTSKAECTAEEAYVNTDGRCLFSSGSPFKPVVYNNKTHYPGQGNNAYIFPAIGLATILTNTREIDEEVFLLAAKSLAKQVGAEDLAQGRVYPFITHIREVSIKIAADICEWYYRNGKATLYPEPVDKEAFIRSKLYDPTYASFMPVTWEWPAEHTQPKHLGK